VRRAAHSSRRSVDLTKGLVSGAGGLLLAVLVALGIPLIWVWIASQLAGTKRDLTPSLAVLITTGILVSYWFALVCGSWARSRVTGEEARRRQVRRMSWNRSFRDEHHPGEDPTDPVERVFVIVAVLAVIAFEIWFFFFAGSPLPNQPAF